MAKILEICVDSLASARAAIAGGADRLELCSALTVSGLTPHEALLRQIREESSIPVRCLMRPRPGDFLYSEEELALLQRQILQLKSAGADGFVFGCLTPEGDLDPEAMKPLIGACSGLGMTLHRCIDVSRNLESAYLDAKDLGFDTVLTSGGASACLKGHAQIGTLLSLREKCKGPEVLIGAGVNAGVIRRLRSLYPLSQAFHMSGKSEIQSRMRFRREGVPMGLPGLDEWHIQQTDEAFVRLARAALDE